MVPSTLAIQSDRHKAVSSSIAAHVARVTAVAALMNMATAVLEVATSARRDGACIRRCSHRQKRQPWETFEVKL